MKKFKFLVFIDDDFMTNRFHEIILGQTKVTEEYKFFTYAKDALEYFKDNNHITPDYIFLDINMPGMDGWEFLKEYTKLDIEKTPTVIMLTTSLMKSDREKADDFDVVKGFMNKPLTRKIIEALRVSFNEKGEAFED